MSNIDKHRSRYSADLLKRLPPGQVITEKWPVLSAGPNPVFDPATWRFRVFGRVGGEWSVSWQEFKSLPRVTITTDMHCVTRWSRLGMTWAGVSIHEVLKHVERDPEARFVMAHSYGGYTTNLPLADLLDDEVLLADTADGEPLSPDHGGPMRLVVPKLYAWKSAKWCNGLELMAADRPGFWENYGYHDHGDPWTEERMRGESLGSFGP
ncbi:MAG TPA: sulfite oxidase-like oxidoreductase [Candidatus Polarisedimenticolia bacterium]|nr:sulfite oxidase-like oxidoreductase [Candidatus Polarisedimenticolia bacterium]